jgi:hypothetical protein
MNTCKIPASKRFKTKITSIGVTNNAREKWMKRAGMRQIAVTLFSFSEIATTRDTKQQVAANYMAFFEEIKACSEFFPKTGPNATLMAAMSFIKELTAGFGLLN